MKYVKQILIIFGITMVGELMNECLPFPIPSCVYGLFLLLGGLCAGWIRIADVEDVGNFLLDTMPLMFIPVSVGLMENYETARSVLAPLLIISLLSTILVMAVTGKAAQWLLEKLSERGENHE